MSNKDVKLHLKVVLNKPKTKVLLVEADNHFTDILLSFMTLPLGKFVQIMQKHYGDEAPFIGSMNTLYSSLLNLDDSYFWTETCKRKLLNPESKFGDECSRMKLDVTDSQPNRYFVCKDYFSCVYNPRVNSCLYYSTSTRCDCDKSMLKEVKLLRNPSVGAFTVKKSSFLITDNLKVFPNVTASLVKIVSEIGVDVIDWGERINVTFGFDEVMDLLKASIFSLSPLTDIVLHKGKCGYAIPGVLSHKIESSKLAGFCKLKVIVQKSTNKLLFVESDEQFVEFLFSLFVIPLGGIEHLVGGVTPFFKNINNLNSSVKAIDNKYFQFDHIKTKLTKLDHLHPGYYSYLKILPLRSETTFEQLYYIRDSSQGREDYLSHSYVAAGSYLDVSYGYLYPERSYVRKSVMFKITDELTVRPLSALDGLDVPLSDVAEQEVSIDVLEAYLSFLMVSLTSTSVLSTVLGPMLMKKPAQ